MHAVYQPGSQGGYYTPGGFWKSSEDVWEHNGSNKLNAAHVYVQIGATREESSLGMVLTNVGMDNAVRAVRVGVDRLKAGEIEVFSQ